MAMSFGAHTHSKTTTQKDYDLRPKQYVLLVTALAIADEGFILRR
jgi:hypothetical protein